jgi:inner membrane protein
MDTLTHALSGALLARAVVPRSKGAITSGEAMLLGALSAAFPDADVVLSFASPLAYLYHHRGMTHSFVMLPLWGLLLAWLWSRLRRHDREGFKACLLVATLGVGIHILGDLITSFGTMILAPWSDARFAWDTTFIIDLWLSGIIVAGLVLSLMFRGSRTIPVAALLVVGGYISFQWLQQQQAIEVGEAYAAEQGLAEARVSALPRPVSPFNWMVIVADAERYHYAFVNLRRTRPITAGPDAGFIARLDAVYQPIVSARWHTAHRLGEGEARAVGELAWRQPQFAFFRWFSAYPVLATLEHGNPVECAWFQDLRFLTPGRDTWPFRYGMCRSPGGEWQAYRHGEEGERFPLPQ